ncbi:MAG: Mechanosensitive ion channel protein MscS [Hyphomicrobiales bacterium]|nr:Mechanosensitive ion channel protein MscS [Hyphomicrobiales bacterium]
MPFIPSRTRVFAPLLLVLALALSSFGALAQSTPEPTRQNMTQVLDGVRATLDQVSATLARNDVTDQQLLALRASLDPLGERVQTVLDTMSPRLEGVKARLDQLGPKADKGPAEEAGVDAERGEQQKAFNDIDGILKRARLLQVEVQQTVDSIVSRRRSQFTGALFARSYSILSPQLWFAVLDEIPQDLRAAGTIWGDWFSAAMRQLNSERGAIFGGIVALIAFLYVFVSRIAKRVLRREPTIAEPSRLQKVLGALWVALVSSVVPIVAVLALGEALRGFEIVGERLEPLLKSMTDAVQRIALAVGITRGLLAPFRPNWRLVDLSDGVATRLAALVVAVATLLSLTKVVEAANELIAVSLPAAVATRGLGALAVALVMGFSLKGIVVRDESEDECLGPRVEPARDWWGPLRLIAWAAVAGILASVSIGYVAFGAFIVEQVVWVTFIGAVFYLLTVLANEGLVTALRPPAPLARGLVTSLGMRRDSLEQFGILLAGVATVCLMIIGVMLVLAPWGIESGDMLGNFRAAFFGFKVGDVTISLSSIVIAILAFGVGLFLTRTIQRWLEQKLLPQTKLDTGLRNSIRTSVGYLGFIVAAALSLSYVGLGFEKFAIVAGALSVGIGFGLQSIVSNFVSGLILLWERMIRVGDWVVVGSDQGYVKRINVRSTEIETFDRATMIVPNSNLVTGVVKNWVRGDKLGRIKVPLSVNLVAEPEHVRDVLIEVAKEQELVVKFPSPSVNFLAMTDKDLQFELVCFISDVEKSGRVKSDLHFAIYSRFKSVGIGIAPPAAAPAPPPVFTIGGLEKLGEIIQAAKT